MVLYKVQINTRVRKKDLASVPQKDRLRIIKRITSLAKNPYPVDAVRLRGREEWRIRQGDYRILYLVSESIVTVYVIKVGHRREIYRK